MFLYAFIKHKNSLRVGWVVICDMDEQEFRKKYINLRVLKSAQDYLQASGETPTAVYPIRVPEDLMYQVLKLHGPEHVDKLLHEIFMHGLKVWSEAVYQTVFGSEQNLQEFIRIMKDRTEETSSAGG
jgi:hypothetical protein